MKKLLKNKKAITLIALVITIVVLVILAAVTISLTVGNDGLIAKAIKAANDYKDAQESDKQSINDLYGQLLVASDGTVSVDQGTLKSIIQEEISAATQEMKETINSQQTQITTLQNEKTNLETRLSTLETKTAPIGTVYTETFSNVSVKKTTGVTLKSITLPAGKYVIVGYASYEGNDLRYHIALGNAISSAYDKYGYVRMNVTDIFSSTTETTKSLVLWVDDKDITIKSGFIKAIKIGN